MIEIKSQKGFIVINFEGVYVGRGNPTQALIPPSRPAKNRLTQNSGYEQSYCARANMERWIGEFKSECYGARASASKFTTNSWRMILAMLCQLLLKIARRFRLLGLQKCGSSKRNCVERTVRVFRRDNICVTARVDTSAKRLTLTLPVHLHDEEGFRVMFAIPI